MPATPRLEMPMFVPYVCFWRSTATTVEEWGSPRGAYAARDLDTIPVRLYAKGVELRGF